jgi:hypothetical protein
MNREELTELFLEMQFDDFVGILFDKNIINEDTYDYYLTLYYNDLDYKENFIENVLDRLNEIEREII